jgi:lipopolysaccharide transport system ATP-binding protein
MQLIKAENIHKKFCKDIRHNLLYGLQDMVTGHLTNSDKYLQLRKNEFLVLKNINLTINSGEIVAIIGINGSGKTSLIRVLSGIYPCHYGNIVYKKGLRIIPIFSLQSGMRPYFTGRENIYIQGSMYGMTRKEIEKSIAFVSDFSELADKLDQPYGNYSSGMSARLAYAIAAATEPDVFIIDEALAVGDMAFKAKCFEHLRSFVKKDNKAVLFITNRVNKLSKLATRVIVLHNGEIAFESQDIDAAIQFYLNHCSNLKDNDLVRQALEWD